MKSYIEILNSVLGEEEYTLVKSRKVDSYLCDDEIAYKELISTRCYIGKYEGLPTITEGRYKSSDEQNFIPLVYERKGKTNKFDLLQDFILCYDLDYTIEDCCITSYCEDDTTVVIIKGEDILVKTSYIDDYLKKRNKKLLFLLEFNIENNNLYEKEKKQLALVINDNNIKEQNNFPYVNYKFLYKVKY